MIRVYERPLIEVEQIECERGFINSWDTDVFEVQKGTSNGEDDSWV